jgi:hypothetical protein
MKNDDFKIPILLQQMEKDSQVVYDLLGRFKLRLKEIEYSKNDTRPPSKYFNLETFR